MSNKKKRLIAASSTICLIALFCLRLSIVNHSDIMKTRAEKIRYRAGEVGYLCPGYDHYGYADLSGYTIQLHSAEIQRVEDLMSQYPEGVSYLEHISGEQKETLLNSSCLLVEAEINYLYSSEENDKIVDLENMTIVGRNYELDFSSELHKVLPLTPALAGDTRFIIRSGNPLTVLMPYVFSTKGIGSIPESELKKRPPELLVSRYPTEVYMQIEEIQ